MIYYVNLGNGIIATNSYEVERQIWKQHNTRTEECVVFEFIDFNKSIQNMLERRFPVLNSKSNY